MDGYYLSDYPIDYLTFLSDSILMILVNKKEVRILFIPSFLPGSFAEDGLKLKQIEDSKSGLADKGSMFRVSLGEQLIRDLSLKAEVEKGTKILNQNTKYALTRDSQNFNNRITTYENSFVVLEDEILCANLYLSLSYLLELQHKYGWIVCMKAALEIYNGDMKGFSGVPCITEEREATLIDPLKDLVKQGISKMVKLFHGSRLAGSLGQGNLEEDNNTIKVAIEFCHEIKANDFLFSKIFEEFEKEGFEDKFVENLEPFILGGYFKEELIPDVVLKRIVDYYLEQRKYDVLARIVSCLNFSSYEYLEELTTICTLKNLTTTLVHLIITSNQLSSESSCTKILNCILE